MSTPTVSPSYSPTNADSLNKFLLGTLRELKNKEVKIEEAEAISKISDKIIKLNLTRLLYKKSVNSEIPIDFFEATSSNLLIEKTQVNGTANH